MNTDTEYDALKRYDDYLDEAWGTAQVCGMEFDSSRALRELDPTAYRTGFNDWLDIEGLEVN